MKICFVSYECPPEAGGGIGTYIEQAANMLAQRGHHVEVFAGSRDTGKTVQWPSGVMDHRVAAPDRRKFPELILPVFIERHRQVGFDVIEGPDYMAEGHTIRNAVPEIPFVTKLHTTLHMVKQIDVEVFSTIERWKARWNAWRRGTPPEWSPHHPTTQLEYNEVKAATRIAAPSRSIGERMIGEWDVDPSRVDYFPYPFTPSESYLSLPVGSQNPVVTFVGRLEIRKGVINLTKAIPRILKARPDARFRFVGGTLSSPRSGITMLDYLKKHLSSHNQNVEFLGRRSPQELPTILGDTAVCVFPSLWENFPFVCLEAMAAGRAVVASHHCGLAEQLDQGRVGKLIDPRDPGDIAEKIIELLNHPELCQQYGEAARQRVLQCYSTEVVGPLQESCYERACKN